MFIQPKTLLAIFAMVFFMACPSRSSGQAPARGEPLAIVVHKTNPVENLTHEELRKFCLAERRQWSHGRRVTIALREAGHPERDCVLQHVYGMTEMEFTRHFLQGKFTGEILATPKQLATGTGVRRFVFNVPGAIGFVRFSEVDDTVKVLKLDGHSPTNGAYRLTLPSNASKDSPSTKQVP
jgi:ABC-type phosphate transport system substrate-binding protein